MNQQGVPEVLSSPGTWLALPLTKAQDRTVTVTLILETHCESLFGQAAWAKTNRTGAHRSEIAAGMWCLKCGLWTAVLPRRKKKYACNLETKENVNLKHFTLSSSYSDPNIAKGKARYLNGPFGKAVK